MESEQLAHREEEEEEEKEFMKLTSNFHNSHTSEHCGILSIDIFLFTTSVLCGFYLFFPGSSLKQREGDENDDGDGSESNEDKLTVKHNVLRKILDYLYTRLGLPLHKAWCWLDG